MPGHAPQTQTRLPLHAPVTVTQEEYETVWKPAGWRLIIIGPTSTWRTEWGEWEAIRDIVQNCLDEAEKYYYGYDDDGMWIADTGKGVAVADFLLGPPKLKPDWARGKYGEGMKIAALTLLRKGYPIHVETVKRELWIVFTEQQVNGRVKTLAALWKPYSYHKGTKFHIIGYRGSSYEKNFAVNLPATAILAEAPSIITKPKQRYNQLIRTESISDAPDAGVIYCRDIFLQGIVSPFSYNLWGFELAPDRHGPKSESDMWVDAGRLWASITKVPLLTQLIGMMTDPPRTRTSETMNLHMVYMGNHPITHVPYVNLMIENQRIWQQAWNRAVGKNTVLQLNARLTSMVQHLGYTSVVVEWGVRETFGKVIKTDEVLINEMASKLSQTVTIPDNKLTGKQLAHLELARAIAVSFSKVGPVDAAVIPPASDAVERTAGVYEFGPAAIRIHVDMLNIASDMVSVMVHELGHHRAYIRTGSQERAGDLTRDHAEAMEEVAAIIFRSVVEGQYDEYLKKVSW